MCKKDDCDKCIYKYVCKELWEVYIDAISDMCLFCRLPDEENLNEDCTVKDCPLNYEGSGAKDMKNAIRKYCLDCKDGSPDEVAKCDFGDCPLYVVRIDPLSDYSCSEGE